MADISLKIDSGDKEIELINEKRGLSVSVIVAVYDVFFLGSIMEAAEKLDALQSDMEKLAPGENGSNEKFIEFFRKSREVDAEMRGVIDELFGVAVCDALFPRQSMFAIGNGAPTWANILYSVIDQMDDGLEDEKKKAQTRIRKYSAKYKKK